ncbi:MAG TPA: hypothetical protein VHK26_04770 [Methyloceanibacter sp.]|nr:hypothetical protein [Methyloceanibacter sp.]
MTAICPSGWSESDQKAVREELGRILQSGPFVQSRRRQRFLEYIVNETLEGRGDRLKGYNIGLEVFDRPEAFDPAIDPIVRIEAARLRDKLREYYDADGQTDPVRIDLPKGSYTPHIEFRHAGSGAEETTARAERGEAAAPRSGFFKTPFVPLVASTLAVLLLLVGGLTAWWWTRSATLPEKASIAVLPFENIGNDPKWSRFADGVTEDIVTDLSHSKDLFVVARNSTEVYRDKPADVRTIGRDLGVRYVLEGSIQPSGNQIRVTAQLVDTKTGGHVWCNRYLRPATDLFDVQSDVTEKIVGTLIGYAGAVAEAERSLIRRKAPSDLTAYDTYLLGMEAKHTVTKEGLDEGERLLRKSLEIDPQLARAYVGLAYVYEYRIDFGLGTSVADNLAKLMDSMRNAVRLDPNDGETQLVLGHAFAYHGMPEQALEQFAKAEALAPHNADVLILIAWFLPHSLFVEGARKAGVAACVPAHKVLSMPNLIRIKACDEERARQAAG